MDKRRCNVKHVVFFSLEERKQSGIQTSTLRHQPNQSNTRCVYKDTKNPNYIPEKCFTPTLPLEDCDPTRWERKIILTQRGGGLDAHRWSEQRPHGALSSTRSLLTNVHHEGRTLLRDAALEQHNWGTSRERADESTFVYNTDRSTAMYFYFTSSDLQKADLLMRKQ